MKTIAESNPYLKNMSSNDRKRMFARSAITSFNIETGKTMSKQELEEAVERLVKSENHK